MRSTICMHEDEGELGQTLGNAYSAEVFLDCSITEEDKQCRYANEDSSGEVSV